VNEEQARDALLQSLAEVAPEADPGTIDADAPLAEQLDLDSIDFLNLIVAVAKRTGVEVPERDYPQLETLNGATAYLVAHQPL
jgi:acyl carrier protein